MDVLLEVTVLFTLVLALAFLVERILEILKAIYDFLDSRFDWYRFWTGVSVHWRDCLSRRIRKVAPADPKRVTGFLKSFRRILLAGGSGVLHGIPVVSGDLVRKVVVRVALKITGILVGILLAIWLRIDLITVWQHAALNENFTIPGIRFNLFRAILTGIILGLGAGPVHRVIILIERKKEKHRSESEAGHAG